MNQSGPAHRSQALPIELFAALALLAAVAPISIDMYLPAFVAMAEELHTSATNIQLTLTAFMFGLALGQLILGPLSDRYGRRGLLVAGSALCLLASIACIWAPSVELLIVARLLQGIGGSAGVVLGRAVVSDRVKGVGAVQVFSLLAVVGGIAPIIAPLAGGGLFLWIGWRGIFAVVSGLAALMLLAVLVVVKESLPVQLRQSGGIEHFLSAAGLVIKNRFFVGYAAAFCFGFGVLFAYISASPFVVVNVLGMTTTAFTFVFAGNAIALTMLSFFNARLVRRYAARSLLRVGLIIICAASALLLVLTAVGVENPWIVLPVLCLALASIGLILGNATALALEQVPRAIGSASAVLGAGQFGLAAVVSPLVGLAGEDTAVPMALVMTISAAVALLAFVTLTRADGIRVKVYR